MQAAASVVQAEQQGANQRSRPILVPAESCDDAVGRAGVLDFDHRALAWLVNAALRFHHHAIESRALEACQPVRCDIAVAGRRRQVKRWCDAATRALQALPPFRLWL